MRKVMMCSQFKFNQLLDDDTFHTISAVRVSQTSPFPNYVFRTYLWGISWVNMKKILFTQAREWIGQFSLKKLNGDQLCSKYEIKFSINNNLTTLHSRCVYGKASHVRDFPHCVKCMLECHIFGVRNMW